MTRFAITAGAAVALTTESMAGGLGGGYIVTRTGFVLNTVTYSLRAVDSLSSAASTAVQTADFADEVASSMDGLFVVSFGGSAAPVTNKQVLDFSRSGSTLSFGTVGSFAIPSGLSALIGAHPDYGATVAALDWQSSSKVSEVNLSTAALSWTFDPSSSGHNAAPIGAVGSDRVLLNCFTHDVLELWEGSTATLLDSIAYPNGVGPYSSPSSFTARPLSGGRMFVSVTSETPSSPPITADIGALSTTGDVLSWQWQSAITTDWEDSFNVFARIGSWGETVMLAPASSMSIGGGLYRTVSLYIVDAATGNVSTSTATDYLGRGVDSVAFADALNFVTSNNAGDAVPWSLVALATSSTLRQRQSPRRSPSRVGWY